MANPCLPGDAAGDSECLQSVSVRLSSHPRRWHSKDADVGHVGPSNSRRRAQVPPVSGRGNGKGNPTAVETAISRPFCGPAPWGATAIRLHHPTGRSTSTSRRPRSPEGRQHPVGIPVRGPDLECALAGGTVRGGELRLRRHLTTHLTPGMRPGVLITPCIFLCFLPTSYLCYHIHSFVPTKSKGCHRLLA